MNFARLKFGSSQLIIFNIVLWCGAVTNAQTKELLNDTVIVRPRPTAVVGIKPSSRLALVPEQPTKMTLVTSKTVAPIENDDSFIKGARTTVHLTMAVYSSSMSQPSQGPMAASSASSGLGLIIGSTIGALVIVVFICLAMRVYKKRNRREEQDIEVNAAEPVSRSMPRSCPRGLKAAQNLRSTDKSLKSTTATVFYNDIAEEGEMMTTECFSKSAPTRPGLAKKIITTDGGVIQINDIILRIAPGCLAEETEITLIKDDQNYLFKSLVGLGLVDAAPRVVEFLPDGLRFLKPADLTIRFERTVPYSELFILHGSYNRDLQRTVWELVTNDVVENKDESIVDMKINGFSFYGYLLSRRGKIARVLSHLNNSFSCRAYALYRRIPSMTTIDIAVLLFSEFVIEDHEKEEDVKQLNDLYEEGYVKGEKGMLKTVHTNRRHEMLLDFPGVEASPFQFKIEVRELDKHGFVVDYFKNITIASPASGTVKISEVHRSGESKLLWNLSIREVESPIQRTTVQDLTTPPDPPEVVLRTTKLTSGEISRISRVIGVDWDSLAGLMDIPYEKREEIRFNHAKYPDFTSKAAEIFALFNCCDYFGRDIVEKCVEELGHHDLKKEILPVQNKVVEEQDVLEVQSIPNSEDQHVYENDKVQLRHTPLSPREMYRLSRRLCRDWDSLAGLMDIAKETRDDISTNIMYTDGRARAEKILSIVNRQQDFSREKLTKCLEDIKQLDVILPITTGAWRNL